MKYKTIFLTFLILLSCSNLTRVLAQSPDAHTAARLHVDMKEYDKALNSYAALYATNPQDVDVYDEYLKLLLQQKEIKTAEKLVNAKLAKQPSNVMLLMDLGNVYNADGKKKKAEETWTNALSMLNGDDMTTQAIAKKFLESGNETYALKTYERATEMLRNPYLYSTEMARLYAKAGNMEAAINTLLTAVPGQMNGVEEMKALLLELLGTDEKKLKLTQKALLKSINEQPDNNAYVDLLTWLYTQRDDWEGALIQMEAIFARGNESGRRLVDFASQAANQKQYGIAIQALDVLINKGKEHPYYTLARAAKLTVGMQRLTANVSWTATDVAILETEYATFMAENPEAFSTPVVQDYGRLLAQFAGKPQAAIDLLKKALQQSNGQRLFMGETKLQLGDYEAIAGKVWDASLTYSQVDKAFREDALGEEARFRNARLAYYRGDFDWAQDQLKVLKASTSELISNDAMYLSILLLENIPPDSNLVPLQRFAYADLLLFQNRDAEAASLLDSLTTAFPKHPLSDDILMLRASLAKKHREYQKALDYLEKIHKDFGEDVLGDDAVFRKADIYADYLKRPADAKREYEQLIIQYPGSTYVQLARERLRNLGSESNVNP